MVRSSPVRPRGHIKISGIAERAGGGQDDLATS